MRVRGGYNTYGQAIGILMMQTRFPRPLGDIGNAETFEFPVLYHVVEGASPQRLVIEQDPSLLQPFIAGARRLEAAGVKAITTSCGFLALFHQEMAQAVSIPVFSSALIQVPMVYEMLGRQRRVGVLTFDSVALTERHFQGVGWSQAHVPVHVVGLQPSDTFVSMQYRPDEYPEVELAQLESEVVAAARRLVDEAPDAGAIVLECTNLPPYARAIQCATGLPVFDIVTLTNMVYQAVLPRTWRYGLGWRL